MVLAGFIRSVRGNKFYKRLTSRFLALAVILYLSATLYYYHEAIASSLQISKDGLSSGPFTADRFYFSLFEALAENQPLPRPGVDELKDSERCNGGDITKSPSKEMFAKASYENLGNCMRLSEEQLEDLKMKHARFVKRINQDLHLDTADFETLWPNDRGIVTVGGSRFSVISVSMLATLRHKGCTLPVEVLIPPEDEGDDDYCNNVLPGLNAKCVFLSEILPAHLTANFEIKRYQFKLLGLMVSSFRRVLFLDADNIPLENVDTIFDEPLFEERGLIIWPDLWRRATAPAFYDIAGIEYDLNKRVRFLGDDVSPVSRFQDPSADTNLLSEVPMHDLEGFMPDPTSESGQLLMNKVQHYSTLLLSLYYNIHWPWYYRLLSQGTAGEGDKETFLAAAYALKMPHYQVKSNVIMDGFVDHKNEYHGIALYQRNFQQDHEQHVKAKQHVQDHQEEYSKYDPTYSFENDFVHGLMEPADGTMIDSLFAHIGYHKFDPFDMAANDIYLDGDKKHFRGFRQYTVLKGFDLELFNFKLYYEALCDPESLSIDFKFYREKKTTSGWGHMCRYLYARVNFLEETHEHFLENTREALDKLAT